MILQQLITGSNDFWKSGYNCAIHLKEWQLEWFFYQVVTGIQMTEASNKITLLMYLEEAEFLVAREKQWVEI